jgi:isopentenyldiphosphate isomerase
MTTDAVELWDLYTHDRRPTGETMVRGDEVPKGRYRLLVHVCIFNTRGELLIQRRQPHKQGWSGLWDLTVGGSVIAGETTAEGAERETREEIGLSLSFQGERPAVSLSFRCGFDDFYTKVMDVDPATLTLQESEVAEVRYASLPEIHAMIGRGEFIPYLPEFISVLFHLANAPRILTAPDTTKRKELLS